MSVLLKPIQKFNNIPIKIPTEFFANLERIKVNLKWQKERTHKNLEQAKQSFMRQFEIKQPPQEMSLLQVLALLGQACLVGRSVSLWKQPFGSPIFKQHPVTQFISCCLQILVSNSQLLVHHHVYVHTAMTHYDENELNL